MKNNEGDRSLISSFIVGHQELARLLENRVEPTGLTSLEAVVARTILLNRNPTVGAIRAALALPASTSTEIVNRLCANGFAHRESTPFDRRLAVVQLSGPGSEVARMVDAAVIALDSEIQAEADTHASAVTKVVDAIELLAWRERRLRLRHW